MSSTEALPFCWSVPGHDPEQEILTLSAQVARVLAVAGALVAADRDIDLEGLPESIGLVCAKALDLPPGRAQFARLELRRLIRTLDALEITMRTESA